MHALEPALRQGVAALDVALDDTQVAVLLGYLDLLARWNRVHNLTAVREPGEMVAQHLLDCLAVVPPLRRRTREEPATVLDVGAGGGLPGAVLAIACPELAVTCIDAVAKKTAFVRQAAAALAIRNLEARHGRVEAVQERFDLVCARAFASLADLVRLSGEALAEGGSWLAMKGVRPAAEITALPAHIVFHVEPLAVPQLAAQRCIVWMERAGAGPERAPA